MRHLNKINIAFICILVTLISNQIAAECEPSVAKDFPGKVPSNYYGNGQTDSFNCAINGSTELSSLQQSERADLIPESLDNRFYILLGANAGTEGIYRVKNESIYDTSIINATVSPTETKTASNNIEIAFGYVWKEVAVDIEWFGLNSIAYSGSLTQITPNLNFNTTVKGDLTLINIYWIFQDLYNFKFYGLFSGGISNNKSTTSISGATPTVIDKISPAIGLGLGARFNLVSKLYADMAARYIVAGEVKFEAANSAGNHMILKGNRTWLGISARLLWLI